MTRGRVSAVVLERNELRADDTGYLNAVGTGELKRCPRMVGAPSDTGDCDWTAYPTMKTAA